MAHRERGFVLQHILGDTAGATGAWLEVLGSRPAQVPTLAALRDAALRTDDLPLARRHSWLRLEDVSATWNWGLREEERCREEVSATPPYGTGPGASTACFSASSGVCVREANAARSTSVSSASASAPFTCKPLPSTAIFSWRGNTSST